MKSLSSLWPSVLSTEVTRTRAELSKEGGNPKYMKFDKLFWEFKMNLDAESPTRGHINPESDSIGTCLAQLVHTEKFLSSEVWNHKGPVTASMFDHLWEQGRKEVHEALKSYGHTKNKAHMELAASLDVMQGQRKTQRAVGT